jgi:hypothetical protein
LVKVELNIFYKIYKTMILKQKFLHKLVTNLHQNALKDEKESVEENDKKYFLGQSVAYERIKLIMDGDENELFETLQDHLYRNFEQVDDENPF